MELNVASLDDIVNRLLQERTEVESSQAQTSQAAATPASSDQVQNSFEQLIKNAGAAAADKEAAATIAQLREENARLRQELQQSQQASGPATAAPASRPNAAPAEGGYPEAAAAGGGAAGGGVAGAAAATDGGGTAIAGGAPFPWKRHIATVEESLRKRAVQVAEPLIKALLDAAEVISVEIPTRVRLMTQLGTIGIEQGKLAEAEETLKKAITIARSSEAATQADSIAKAFCLDALAQCYQQKEDFENAEKLRRQAVILADEALGAEHPDSGFFRERLENLRQQRQLAAIGADDDSKTLYDKLSEEYNAQLAAGVTPEAPVQPADSYSALMFEKYFNMAKTAMAQKNTREAETNLRSAVEKAAGVPANDPRKCEALRLFAAVLEAAGKDNEARENYEEALRLAFKYLGFNDVQVADCLTGLGRIHSRLNDVGLAKNYLRQAITAYTATLGREHETTVGAQQLYDEFMDRLKTEARWKGWSA
jgi:tetratricopeptide (TPR) repeat protein